MTERDSGAHDRLTRPGAAWLRATFVLLVAATALGVAARGTGVSVPRTLGRALLAPFGFVLELV